MGGAGGSCGSRQRQVADGADVVFTDTVIITTVPLEYNQHWGDNVVKQCRCTVLWPTAVIVIDIVHNNIPSYRRRLELFDTTSK